MLCVCVGDGSLTEGRRPSFCKRSMQRIRRSERDLKLDLSEAHPLSTAAPAGLREERAESLPPASAFKVTVSTFSVLIVYYSVQLYTLCVSISFCYTLKLLFIRFWQDQIRWIILDRQNFGWIKVCRLFQELMKKMLKLYYTTPVLIFCCVIAIPYWRRFLMQ